MCSRREGALGAGGGGDTDWNAWQGQNDARDLRSTSFMSSSVNPGPCGRIYALRGPVTSRGCWWCRGVPGHAPELYCCDMSTYIDTLSLIKRRTNGVCCRREQTLRHWDSHRQTRGRRIDGVRERSAVKIFMFRHPKEGLIKNIIKLHEENVASTRSFSLSLYPLHLSLHKSSIHLHHHHQLLSFSCIIIPSIIRKNVQSGWVDGKRNRFSFAYADDVRDEWDSMPSIYSRWCAWQRAGDSCVQACVVEHLYLKKHFSCPPSHLRVCVVGLHGYTKKHT